MVNCAAPRIGIEELADLAEVLVGLAPHHPLVAMRRLEIFLFGLGRSEIKVLGNTLRVFVFHFDHGIGTAIARAL